MPSRFLSDLEHQQLNQFPPDIATADLLTYFTLSATDLAFIEKRRVEHNRLGFALQLSTLRYLGFCPDDLTTAPSVIVTYLAEQLKVSQTVLAAYAQRAQTRTEHLREIMSYLGFRAAEPADLEHLHHWLVERALGHDRPSLLFQLAAERLYTLKLVRPGVTILERLVISARSQAQVEIYRRLEPLLTADLQKTLDGLLQTETVSGRLPLTWLRQSATANSPGEILATLEKLTFLKQLGVDRWDLSRLSPNRLKQLAQVAKKSTGQALRRTANERRYPILLAFLAQRLIETTDEAVDLCYCLAEADARARRDLDEFHQRMARVTNEKLHLLQQVGQIILDPEVTDDQVRPTIYQHIPQAHFQTAMTECAQIIRPLDDNYFDFLAKRYSYLRQFAPIFLDVCQFRSHLKHDALLEAITLLRELNQTQPPETTRYGDHGLCAAQVVALRD